jgi:CheY-like chemotaxis protein
MKKILIVEDDQNVRELEKNLLESRGYRVIEAGNANEGIALAEKEVPDLVIMDIRLPSKKRGIGAARIIRSRKETANVPILFVTGYVGGDQTREISNIDNSAYLLKPFKAEDLIRLVQEHI